MNERLLCLTASAAVLALGLGLWLNDSPSTPPLVPAIAQKAATPAATTALAEPAKPPEPAADATPSAPAVPPAPARPASRRVPTAADAVALNGEPPVAMPVPPDFLEKLLEAGEQSARFALPDGREAAGAVELLRRDAQGVLLVQGRLTSPEAGFFYFERQTVPGVAGAMVGNVRFDKSEVAYRVEPTGANAGPMLVQVRKDQVICRNLLPPTLATAEPQNAPQAHPITIPIPGYQNGVVPLQSLPGATGVIYLDFDGEPGPFSGWGNFNAAPSGANNTQIKEVWQRVAEDFQGFNLNVTTDRKIFDNAPAGRRQHVMVTPTTTAAPSAGGVAYIGSYNNSGDTVCWAFYTTGKSSAEVISHEVGHTLGLSHDGRISPAEEYYGGHGSGDVGWAPIMGVGYSENLTQWSKGDYLSAKNTEDDLAIITNNNNDVDFRADDFGAALPTAAYLEILANNSVSNEGIIEVRTDVDAFRFVTAGGAVSLTATVVNPGPNLDLLAEIYDAANTFVASNNPDTALNATVTANLAAGEYTLRISGVGRGDPLGDGYTDYGCLGSYLLTGSVVGGVKPERFNIAENSANGATVGTIAPRNAHGANPLTFAIASGNNGGAFTINASTGAVSVVNTAQLNYETLSTRWDDPATFQLFVTITDATDPLLNETVRVVVTVTDVNETPTISGGAVTMLERTRAGTNIFKVTGSDADRFEFPVFSITGGNTGNVFAIEPSTGQITVVADVIAPATFTVTVRATDHGTPALFANATVTITVLDIPNTYVPGAITRTYFENITGTAVTNLTTNAKFTGNNPDSEETLTAFDGGDHGDNYGSAVRGYVIPPVSGTYTFWIASDDSSELRLSPNTVPASATVRASVNGFSDRYDYTKFASQQSAAITLVAGQPYYIDARQKEGAGGDHVAVAWQGPGFSRQLLSGLYLAPFYQNYPPKIPSAIMTVREGTFSGGTVGFVEVTDVNAQDTHGSFAITGGTGASVFGIDAATGRISLNNAAALNAATTPSYTLQVRTSDNGTPVLNGTGTITINVLTPGALTLNGIVQQFWDNIGGNNVSALTSDPRYPNAPSSSRVLTDFNSGTDFAETYGSRIRAYVVPPTTGAYTFYIATDDEGQLRFSTTSNPANATQIASATNATGRADYDTYASQTSAPVTLTAGQRYYIETLQKEGVGGDYIQVAWSGPGIATPTIIPGSALDPFDINVPPVFIGAPYAFSVEEGDTNGTLAGTVLATDAMGDLISYAITGGNTGGAFAINAGTGAITIANSAALIPGQVTNLQITAQDNGGGIYPLLTATATASITVVQDLQLISPSALPANIPNGVGLLLEATNDGKTGTTITWLKVSGPGTVTFDTPGGLTTGATFSIAGAYVLRCTEVNGAITETLDVPVNVATTAYSLTGAKVGAQAITPNHSVAAGVYTINAAGVGIPSGGTPDDFYFVNIPASGNVSITARVVSVAAVNGSNSRAGVMIRESLAADAREVFCGITSAAGARFIYRAADATASASASATAALPYWVRITRSGANFTAFIAPDSNGTAGAFTLVGAVQTIAMSNGAYVGLAATSGSATSAGTTVIDRLTISPSPANIGATVSAGPNATITLPATAALNGTVTDDGKPNPPAAFTTAWTKTSGPGTVTFGNVSAIDTTASFSAAGVYVLRLTAHDSAVKTYKEVAITAQLTPIEQWRQTNFGANAGDPAIAGDNADPEGDGRVNLLEYVLAGDPLVPDSGGPVFDTETIEPDSFLRLNATKNPAATDVTLSIEVTGDLSTPASWTTTGTTVETNTSTTLRVRDNTPISGAAQRSIRLKVTRP